MSVNHPPGTTSYKVENRKKHEARLRQEGLCFKCRDGRKPLPGKKICESCLGIESRRNKKYYEKYKTLVFNHYGWKCQCCGETEKKFLTLDHIDSSGHRERKELGIASGQNYFRWVVRTGFPKHLQTLCANCNLGKHWNGGVCPHELQRGDP